MPFDIYVKIGDDKFTKIFNKNDPIDLERFKTYELKGAKNLYLQKRDRRLYINSTEKLIKKILSKENVSIAEAGFAIEELTEQIMFEIYEDGTFDNELLFKTQSLSKAYVQLLKENVNVLTAFLKMSRKK